MSVHHSAVETELRGGKGKLERSGFSFSEITVVLFSIRARGAIVAQDKDDGYFARNSATPPPQVLDLLIAPWCSRQESNLQRISFVPDVSVLRGLPPPNGATPKRLEFRHDCRKGRSDVSVDLNELFHGRSGTCPRETVEGLSAEASLIRHQSHPGRHSRQSIRSWLWPLAQIPTVSPAASSTFCLRYGTKGIKFPDFSRRSICHLERFSGLPSVCSVVISSVSFSSR